MVSVTRALVGEVTVGVATRVKPIFSLKLLLGAKSNQLAGGLGVARKHAAVRMGASAS